MAEVVRRYDPTDTRLGRHVRHDPRSLAYQVEATDPSTLRSVRHQRFIPVLDQGQLGSCTGNAAVGALGTGALWTGKAQRVLSTTDPIADETIAVAVYSDATKIDNAAGSYPPDDTGSDGLSVAKVLLARNLISGYLHATSLAAALTALAAGPLIVGSEWLQDMFQPDTDGRLHVSGALAGGHEYVVDELDVENERVWLTNSWGLSWGIQGRAYLTWADFGTLLASQGDCRALIPVTQPAPTPQPTPTPTPAPQPVPVPDPDNALEAALRRLLASHWVPKWFRAAAESWLAAQS